MITNNKVHRTCELIQRECKTCLGDGCISCSRLMSRIQKYSDAGIPSNYWMLAFADFSGDPLFKQRVQKIIAEISSVFDNGNSFMFAGPLGVGKTYGITSIIKMALCKDFSARYSSMVEVINQILSDKSSNVVADLLQYDFLAIDEFDSRWIFPSEKSTEIFGSTMEYILRSRFQNGLPTILATNNAEVDDILAGMHGKAFASLRSQYMETIYLSGKDFRKRMK